MFRGSDVRSLQDSMIVQGSVTMEAFEEWFDNRVLELIASLFFYLAR
jgi:hypothetical protein